MDATPLLVSGSTSRRLAALKRQTGLVDAPARLYADLLQGNTLSPAGMGWMALQDEHLQVVVTPRTLLQLHCCQGNLIQVSNPAQPSIKPHLVRLVAKDTSAQTGDISIHTAELRDGVAYLAPLLAHNLELQLHFTPLLFGPRDMPDASHEESHMASTSGWQGKALPVNGIGARGSPPGALPEIKVAPGWASQTDLAHPGALRADIPQAGRIPARVRVADSVVISRLRQPQPAVLATGYSGQDKMEADGGLDGGHKSGKIADQSAEDVGPSESQAAEDSLSDDNVVAALQHYLKAKQRLFVEGDIFAVWVPDISGKTNVLEALFAASEMPGRGPSAGQLVYFKVDEMQPAWLTSMLLDPTRSSVTLQGDCTGCIPVGIQGFMQSCLGTPSSAANSSREIDQVEHDQALYSDEAWPAASGALPVGDLGLHVVAAWQLAPRLPGIGPLLPLWRGLTTILLPMMHTDGARVQLRTATLLHGPSGSGKMTAAKAAAAALGVHLVPFSCQELRGPSDAKSPAALRTAFEAAQHFAPALLLLRDLPALADSSAAAAAGGKDAGASRLAAALSECLASTSASDARGGDARVLLVATAGSAADVPPALRRCFTHELSAEAPGLPERTTLLDGLLQRSLLPHGAVADLVTQTAGLLPSELIAMVSDACGRAVVRVVDTDAMVQGVVGKVPRSVPALKGPRLEAVLGAEDLEWALEGMRKRTAAAIGAPQVPNVRWEDVGGLEGVKEAILETVELPLRHPELFASGLRRRSGLLLYGPPGTGKTLVAKAVATECSLNFLSVKGPELINMYIGESERQVREVFARARRARPCVLFFDELDSLAPARGGGADSGGVMDRVVSQLLAEVDGLQSAGSPSSASLNSQDVFLIGATNRPDLLDTALMRPGRLDKLLYVGIAEQPSDKLKVLQALTRKFRLAPSVALEQVAARCGRTLTGADLYALCADAWMAGLHRLTDETEDADEADDVIVEQEDFLSALAHLTPSLSQEELARYQGLRQRYEGQSL